MDGNIQHNNSMVYVWEGKANLAGEELKQLESRIKEEGLSCVKWCLVVSVNKL